MKPANISQLVADIKNQDYKIPITDDKGEEIGFLSPITYKLIDNQENIISLLTKWRKTFKNFFLTQFEVSHSRTKKWLEQVVIPSENRILFLIFTLDEEPIGQIGLCNINLNSFELDNLIRGEKGGVPKLIYYSEIALLKWTFSNFDIENAVLHVFSNNLMAISLHEKIGFQFVKQHYLQRIVLGNQDIIYSIVDEIHTDLTFTYWEMSLTKDKFKDLMLD